MIDAVRIKRNKEQIDYLHPSFAKRIIAIISELEHIGFRPRIICSWRSPEEQKKAYNEGKSKLLFGWHNLTDSGKPDSCAVDMIDDDRPFIGLEYPCALWHISKLYSCETGAKFGLPKNLINGLNSAQWTNSTKIGWDSCHVQPNDLQLWQAKLGLRPTDIGA